MHLGDFDVYKDLLMEKSGLMLTPDKSYLLDSRLTPIARKFGFANLETLTAALRGVPKPELVTAIVEAMTTNETSFFRDSKPFDQFRDVLLPYMLKAREKTKQIRIWCAACSSGQEPYSLAMLLKEQAPKLSGWKIEIVGTDISHEILEAARRGEYSQFEVQRGLPIQFLMKYFEQKGDRWHIKNDIKSMVQYRFFNLLEPMALLGRFDIIYCRNVLIYFDKDTKAKVLNNISGLMPDDGFLLLGGAETVLGISDKFKTLDNARGIYIKPENKDAPSIVPPQSAVKT